MSVTSKLELMADAYPHIYAQLKTQENFMSPVAMCGFMEAVLKDNARAGNTANSSANAEAEALRNEVRAMQQQTTHPGTPASPNHSVHFIRLRLDNSEIARWDKTRQQIVAQVHQLGGHWTKVMAGCRKDNILELYVGSRADEDCLRAYAMTLSYFNFHAETLLLWSRYYVASTNIAKSEISAGALEAFKNDWNNKHGPSLHRVRWSWSKIVFCFINRQHAEEMLRMGSIIVDFAFVTIEPYDPTWDIMFCNYCARPGYEKKHCQTLKNKEPSCCGKCNLPHEHWQCTSPYLMCPTCGGDHEVWSIFCKQNANRRATCAERRRIGLDWSNAIIQEGFHANNPLDLTFDSVIRPDLATALGKRKQYADPLLEASEEALSQPRKRQNRSTGKSSSQKKLGAAKTTKGQPTILEAYNRLATFQLEDVESPPSPTSSQDSHDSWLEGADTWPEYSAHATEPSSCSPTLLNIPRRPSRTPSPSGMSWDSEFERIDDFISSHSGPSSPRKRKAVTPIQAVEDLAPPPQKRGRGRPKGSGKASKLVAEKGPSLASPRRL
ncbi:hypothetical protein BDV96DRAFT_53816 [Lophiotrema nucula]|uniref:Uncharacterized protein n=1 Tax=Lophiotrema nucula TaxID=690887 RepID=A0A6A5ZB55_9PLEO|nr:hypothetical protein BDV96DRAFT_53816 [Lophiotrema nucula]